MVEPLPWRGAGVADQTFYFSIDEAQDNVELFRVRPDGAVERVESGSDAGLTAIENPAGASLGDIASGSADIISSVAQDELLMLESMGDLVGEPTSAPADEDVDIFVATDLNASDLIADLELVAGDEIALDELLDLASFSAESTETADTGGSGAESAQTAAGSRAATLEFPGNGLSSDVTFVVDDGSSDTPVTI